jgi:DNA-binding MarR family transcriptional regulator
LVLWQPYRSLSLTFTNMTLARDASDLASEREFRLHLTQTKHNMYIHLMVNMPIHGDHPSNALFALPCACQNLRRVTRLVTRIYDQELRRAGIEITQFGLLTALAIVGEANQKALSVGFAMDSTTLTRTLALLRKQGWIHVRPGKDKRERVFRLTEAGIRQVAAAQPHWQAAEHRLRKALGAIGWKQMQATVARVTSAATGA